MTTKGVMTMTTETTTEETVAEETNTISFRMREHYVTDEDNHLHCREFDVTGTESESPMGEPVYDLIRSDTGEKVFPFQLHAFELIGERTYVAVSGYGMGWGKADSLKEALQNLLKASGITKAKARKLDVLRGINVYECAKDTGYVTGMGGAMGLALEHVRATDWMGQLWDLVAPPAKRK